MTQFKSDGISGYVGKRKMMRKPRKQNRRARKFAKRVTRIVEKNDMVKNVYTVLSNQQITRAVGVTGAYGKQSYAELAIKNSSGDIYNIMSIIQTATGVVGYYTGGFNIDAYILQISMKNQQDQNAIVDLYELAPRVATQKTPTTMFADMANRQSNGQQPDVEWGCTPFQIPAFCEQFKVIAKTRYMLSPGACEMVEIRSNKLQKIDIPKWYGINQSALNVTTSGGVPKYTRYYWAIVRGEPVNDGSNNVSSSTYKVDFTIREDYHYTYNLNDVEPYQKSTNNLPALNPNTEKTVIIETGAIQSPPLQA